jgi:hypothetical protein
MSDEHSADDMERMQAMGQKFSEFRKYFKTHFKDMEIEVRDWNFGIGKEGKTYIVSFGCKVAATPKPKAEETKE